MPYDELIRWTEYFSKRPVGWQEDQRTFLLMKSFGAKGNPEDFFATLRVIKENDEKLKAASAGRVVPTGRFLEMMRKARDGDVKDLPWEFDNGEQGEPRSS